MDAIKRQQLLKQLDTQTFDVIVIGGGATGFGVAVDAASRGFQTLLLEQHDFGKGTSSRSTKLIHGGLRYLKQMHFGLVKESLKERGILLRIAPHLVHPLAFVIPTYSFFENMTYRVGVKMYDWLSGNYKIEHSTSMGKDKLLDKMPELCSKDLYGGITYFDAQFDDTRLLFALMRTLLDLGSLPLNYMKVTSFVKKAGKIIGLEATDAETTTTYKLFAPVIINATGVFTDNIRKLDDRISPNIITASQGIHIVLKRNFFPHDHAMIIPETDDGRIIFVIPWNGHTLVGTTDTWVKNIHLEPKPFRNEVRFLISHLSRYLNQEITDKDILSVFAGLRPLLASKDSKYTAKMTRGHSIFNSPSGLITITGGKWTAYRKMGEDTVNHAIALNRLPNLPSKTETLHLHGWLEYPKNYLEHTYGSDASYIEKLCREQAFLKEKIHPDFEYIQAEVIWACRYEMARTLEDVLARRMRALFLNAHAALEAAPIVLELMAQELNKDESWKQNQLSQFQTIAKNYLYS